MYIIFVRFKFTPRITGRDVQSVLDDPAVDKELAKLDIDLDEGHNLVKAIMIAAFRDGTWDINKIISAAKSR